MRVRHALAIAFATVVLAEAPAHAARPVQPPLRELTRNHNYVLVAQAESREGDKRIVFKRTEALHATGDEVITVRMDEETRAGIELGKSYIVAYTDVTDDGQLRDHKFLDPEGPRLLSVRGLGTPALFEVTPELRFLIRTARAEKAPSDREVLDALLTQMARPDANARSLVVLEFYLRPQLQTIVGERDEATIRKVITDAALDTELKSFLLEASLKFPRPEKAAWLKPLYRQIIDTSGAQFDLTTHIPGMVETAVKGLRVLGERADTQRLKPLLLSNAPAVAKAALATMDELDPEGTPVAVQQTLESALWNDDVNPEVRRTLESYDFEHRIAGADARH